MRKFCAWPPPSPNPGGGGGALSCRGSGGVEQFAAGDVQLRLKGGAGGDETVQALRRQAGELMRPYWTDGGFAFAGVRG